MSENGGLAGNGAATKRRKIQEVDCGVDRWWAAVHQTVTKRMLDHLHKSEVLRVNVQELEFHVLAPNESIVMQARGERNQRLFQAFSRQGAN